MDSWAIVVGPVMHHHCVLHLLSTTPRSREESFLFWQAYAQVPASPPPGESSVTISVVRPTARSVEADTGLPLDRSRLRKSHTAAVS